MLVRSAVTSAMPSIRRLRLPDFFVSMWFPVALRCSTFPLRVMRNRFDVALCAFCFGIRPYPSLAACASAAASSTWSGSFFFVGAITMIMLRPSCFGVLST
jgi:hypothetical protein